MVPDKNPSCTPTVPTAAFFPGHSHLPVLIGWQRTVEVSNTHLHQLVCASLHLLALIQGLHVAMSNVWTSSYHSFQTSPCMVSVVWRMESARVGGNVRNWYDSKDMNL